VGWDLYVPPHPPPQRMLSCAVCLLAAVGYEYQILQLRPPHPGCHPPARTLTSASRSASISAPCTPDGVQRVSPLLDGS